MTRKLLQETLPNEYTKSQAEITCCAVENAKTFFCALCDIEWTEDRARSLSTVLETAMDTFQKLHFQKSLFKLDMIIIHVKGQFIEFQTDHMEDVTGEDDALLKDRLIEAIMFPMVSKVKNEHGDTVCISLIWP